MNEARATLVFVDAVDAAVGRARLLLGEIAFEVPLGLLPEGVREGTWLRISAAHAAGPDPARLRRELGRGDPGGPIKL